MPGYDSDLTTDNREVTQYPVVPAGEYPAILRLLKPRTTQLGRKLWGWGFRITRGEYADAWVWGSSSNNAHPGASGEKNSPRRYAEGFEGRRLRDDEYQIVDEYLALRDRECVLQVGVITGNNGSPMNTVELVLPAPDEEADTSLTDGTEGDGDTQPSAVLSPAQERMRVRAETRALYAKLFSEMESNANADILPAFQAWFSEKYGEAIAFEDLDQKDRPGVLTRMSELLIQMSEIPF